MKKILLLMLALVAIGSFARAEEFIRMSSQVYGLLPEYIEGGKYLIYEGFYNENSGESGFTIYNDQFDPIKTINYTPKRYDYTQETIYNDGRSYVDEYYEEDEILNLSVLDYFSITRTTPRFSQTLFNDDAKFEYVRTLYEITSFEEKYSSYTKKYTNYPLAVGFQIYSEDGKVLQTVKFPSDYRVYNSPDILIFGEKPYLCFDADKGDDFYHLFYPITKGTNSIQAPKILKGSAKVHPTKVNSSEVVNVTFDYMLEHNCNIEVVSLNGSVAYRTVAQAGCESAQINTSRLSPGIYIVNIHDGKEIKENCKIIIR